MKIKLQQLLFLSVILLGSLLSGCAFINGLGSDNTPKPSPLVTFKPQFNVNTLWADSAGSGIGVNYLKLGPAANANAVFVADPKGKVTAFAAPNGQQLWRTNIHAHITSGPSIGEGLVVVATADAQVFALNQTTGAIVWHVAVPNQVLAAPQIGQGKVIINTISGKLCALASNNGQQLWVYDHGAPVMILRGSSVPQIVGDKVIAGFADGKLAAFSLDQGTLLWQQTIAVPQGASQVQQMVDIVADPVVANGVIYVATYQGNIAALTLQSGQILWQQHISSYTGLVLGQQQVFITDAQGVVWAFARSNGVVNWRQTQLMNRVLSPPALMNNAIVVADGEGYVHWLSPQDGHFLARVLAVKKQSIFAAPQVVGNVVYVAAKNSDIIALQTTF